MTFKHHDVEVELDDTWRAEAGMQGFIPRAPSYRTTAGAEHRGPVLSIRIDEMPPVRRAPGVGVFNTDRETGRSPRERVVSICRAFRDDVALPPVEVLSLESTDTYRYRLVHGAHRFYCSIAAGFTHVPAVLGFDWSTLDPR